ncbi:MAG: hypothetical protein ABSB22_20950, partial [Thermodesulfobacteriota bacterium]
GRRLTVPPHTTHYAEERGDFGSKTTPQLREEGQKNRSRYRAQKIEARGQPLPEDKKRIRQWFAQTNNPVNRD